MARAYRNQETPECIAYAEYLHSINYPFMRLACEIPTTNFGILKNLKKQGFEKGYPDFFGLAQNKEYKGLVVEMKSLVGNFPVATGADEQHEFLLLLAKLGCAVYVCKGAEVAIEVTKNFLDNKIGHIYLPQEHSYSRRPRMVGRCYNLL
jgi:hypothetical protein